MAARDVRIGVLTDDPYLAEQVQRVAEAAHATVVRSPGATVDVWLVDDRGAPDAGPHGGGDVPTVALRWGDEARPPVAAYEPGRVLELPVDAEPLLRHLGTLRAAPRARVVGVVGLRGGVGSSSLSAALARAVVGRGVRTALVEMHPASGGLDLLLGLEHEPGPRWADLRRERVGFPADALALALPTWHAARVLSGDRRGGPGPTDPGVRDALRALSSTHDVVVLDAPGSAFPGGPPMDGDPFAGGHGPDVALLVGLCDVRSAAAGAVLRRSVVTADVRLVLRRRRNDVLHPAEVAEACGVGLTAVMATERGGSAASDRGEEPGDRRRGALARTAQALLDPLGLVR